MTDFLEAVLRCRPDDLPVEILAEQIFNHRSRGLTPIHECYNTLELTQRLNQCYHIIDNVCTCTSPNGDRKSRGKRPSIVEAITHRCPEINKIIRQLLAVRENRSIDATLSDVVRKSLGGGNTTKSIVIQKLLRYNSCRAIVDLRGRTCRHLATIYCQQSPLVAAKVVRTSLAALERTLQRPEHRLLYPRPSSHRAVALGRRADFSARQ